MAELSISAETGKAVSVVHYKIKSTLKLIFYVICFDPGDLAASPDSWDVSFLGAAASRARTVAFSDPYVEIPCSFLVPNGGEH